MPEILLYGIIGDRADRLDARTVTDLIRIHEGDLDVRINSPGGLVFDGLPIYEALVAYDRGQVRVHIDGLAASMASVIAMAGDEITMADSALMMVHRPWDSAIGNADDLRKDAGKLEKVEAQLVGIYARQTGLSASRISSMLAAETWMTADEAIQLGFASASVEPLKIAAMADISQCGFRNIPSDLKEQIMPATPAQRQPQAPTGMASVAEIRAMTTRHGLPDGFALDLAERNLPLEQARAAILDELATMSERQQIGFNGPSRTTGLQTLDNPDFHARAVGDAIYARMSGKAPEGAARELMSASMVDLAREMLQLRGVQNVLRLRPSEVLAQASWSGRRGDRDGWVGVPRGEITHTTSDFPSLLQGAGQRFLMDQFAAVESVLKQVARERTAADFRSITGLQLSGFGTLPEVGEAGEIKHGTFSERKESYSVRTFAKMFTLSRNAIINDDLGAFSDPLTIMARAAAETEAQVLVTLLNSNPVLSDGVAFFHANHGNLAAPGAVPSVAALDKARGAMRKQKDLDGETLLNIALKYLVVPSELETATEVLTGNYVSANAAAEANPFAGKVVPLVEPRLTSATAWYGFADPAQQPALEYAYLNGERGPQTESKEGWNVLGTEFRVHMDFGAGAVDHRPAYKNPGA